MGGVSKIRKNTFRIWTQKMTQQVAEKSSNWLPESIQNPPKTVLEFNTKNNEKINPEIPNLGSKMGEVFGVFGS